MKEFKFRVWNKSSKRWDSQRAEINDQYLTPVKGVWVPEDCILCFFTGLKDVNGKEVYEGDILNASARGGNFSRTGVVNFNSQTLGPTLDDKIGSMSIWPSLYRYEVLGNIFENLELI